MNNKRVFLVVVALYIFSVSVKSMNDFHINAVVEVQQALRDSTVIPTSNDIFDKNQYELKKTFVGFTFAGGMHFGESRSLYLVSNNVASVSGKYWSAGFFGRYYFNDRNSLRTTLKFEKHYYTQLIDELYLAVSMPTTLKLQASNNEIGFGVDYSYKLFNEFYGFNICIGLGASYQIAFDAVANNRYGNTLVEKAIENDIRSEFSPLAYNFHVIVEKKVEEVMISFEPRLIFQNRKLQNREYYFSGEDFLYNRRIELAVGIKFR